LRCVASPLQCNRGRTFVGYDVGFVYWQRKRATGGYVTGRLKGVAETWLKHNCQAPTGNQTGPSWLLRLRSGSAQALLRGCTASTQGKAATAQGGGLDWSWEKIILCPTIGVLGNKTFFPLLTQLTLYPGHLPSLLLISQSCPPNTSSCYIVFVNFSDGWVPSFGSGVGSPGKAPLD
jgi:hypothetical protein